MKHNAKMFLSGMLVMALLVAMTLSVFSASQTKTIEISYGDISIVVDGKQIEPKDGAGNPVAPFISDGTTYLPVRAVANALGKEVSWDAATKTVYLGKASAAGEFSRSNPAPVGTAQSIHYSDFMNEYDARIQITESYRGAEAWAKIKAANMFNAEAPEGKEYILIKASATLTNIKDDKAISLNSYSFTPYSSKNVEYADFFSVVEPDPIFNGKVFSNGTLEGYIAFLVDVTDPNPKVVFGENYDGTSGIWFALAK